MRSKIRLGVFCFFLPGVVVAMELRCLPPGVFQTLLCRTELLVVKVPGSPSDDLTGPELALYDFWGEVLACEWEQPEWHERLHTLADFLKNHFNESLNGLHRYNKLRCFNSFGERTRSAVMHRFHSGKYSHTMSSSPDGNHLRPATAGDAILRLLTTAVVDAIADVWRRNPDTNEMSWFVKGFTREGSLCESEVARQAQSNKNLALLFDKMRVGELLSGKVKLDGWGPERTQKIKGGIMECLIFQLYETTGECTRLAEFLFACMVQALVFFVLYDIEEKRSLLPFLAR